MIRESVTFDEVLEFFNEMARVDSDALTALCDTRVPCNDTLADHPTVQVGADEDGGDPKVGLIGLLNGLLGAYGSEGGAREGWGAFAAVYDEGKVVRFERLEPKEKK